MIIKRYKHGEETTFGRLENGCAFWWKQTAQYYIKCKSNMAVNLENGQPTVVLPDDIVLVINAQVVIDDE